MSKHHSILAAMGLAIMGTAMYVPAQTAHAADATVKCHLKFTLSGWAVIYKHATGAGTVSCDNGQHARVKISVVGGGLAAGKYHIDDGQGEISNVHSIKEVFGGYAQAGADAGVVKSAGAQVLTKGTTSLALTGTGQGINLGISVGKFTITPR